MPKKPEFDPTPPADSFEWFGTKLERYTARDEMLMCWQTADEQWPQIRLVRGSPHNTWDVRIDWLRVQGAPVQYHGSGPTWRAAMSDATWKLRTYAKQREFLVSVDWGAVGADRGAAR